MTERVLFATKRVLFVTERVLFATKRVLFVTERVRFATKRVLFITERVLFAAKRTLSVASKPLEIALIQPFFNHKNNKPCLIKPAYLQPHQLYTINYQLLIPSPPLKKKEALAFG